MPQDKSLAMHGWRGDSDPDFTAPNEETWTEYSMLASGSTSPAAGVRLFDMAWQICVKKTRVSVQSTHSPW